MVGTEISYSTKINERNIVMKHTHYLVININKSCRIRSMGLCEEQQETKDGSHHHMAQLNYNFRSMNNLTLK